MFAIARIKKNKKSFWSENSSKKLKPYMKQIRSASKIYYFPKQNLILCISMLLEAFTSTFKKDISTVFNTLAPFYKSWESLQRWRRKACIYISI